MENNLKVKIAGNKIDVSEIKIIRPFRFHPHPSFDIVFKNTPTQTFFCLPTEIHVEDFLLERDALISKWVTYLAQKRPLRALNRIFEISGLGVFDLKKITQISEPIYIKRPIKKKGRPVRQTIIVFAVVEKIGAAEYEAVLNEENNSIEEKFIKNRTKLVEAWKKYHNQ